MSCTHFANNDNFDAGNCALCRREGLLAGRKLPPAKPVAGMDAESLTQPASLPCVHRGAVIEWGQCEWTRVYDCDLHERCALHPHAKLKPNIIKCSQCPDRTTEPPLIVKPTIAITHWKRPDALARLQASLATHLSGWPVEVEDTAGNLSAGRNRLYSRIETQYLVVMEEDFLPIAGTAKGLRDAVAILDHDAAIQGVGGVCIEKPQRKLWQHNFVVNKSVVDIVVSNRLKRRTPTGITYQPCDLVLNWGVFRTDLFRRVTFDEDFPIMEHKEFFWRASRDNEFAFYDGLPISHLRDHRTKEYNLGRNRNFSGLVKTKHGFTFGGAQV